MRGFGDFKRIAVIIIPDDEEYKTRMEKNKETNVYTVSEHTENEMKGMFHYIYYLVLENFD